MEQNLHETTKQWKHIENNFFKRTLKFKMKCQGIARGLLLGAMREASKQEN
jgi:hypothetical protein